MDEIYNENFIIIGLKIVDFEREPIIFTNTVVIQK